jgi:hypothetical protein
MVGVMGDDARDQSIGDAKRGARGNFEVTDRAEQEMTLQATGRKLGVDFPDLINAPNNGPLRGELSYVGL